MSRLILAINPGSTSTKIALYNEREQVFVKTLRHSSEEISKYDRIIDQYEFRRDTILEALKENGVELNSLTAIVGRGGLLKPIPAGVYEVNEKMISDLREAAQGEHASNLGAIIADNLAKQVPGCRAFIADPVVVDELQDVARISGHPLFPKISIFHALNQRAIARMYAESVGKSYSDLNLIVVHLGGGVSVGAHCRGRIIDVNNALDGEGPFSPERSGTLPALQLAKACFSGEYTYDQVKSMIVGKGGIVAHLGTNSMMEVENKVAEGDPKFTLISDAFAYNVAKCVGSMAVVLSGNVDAILITGGIAYNKPMMKQIEDMVKFIAPVRVYPGEDEMGALAMNGLAVLDGKEEAKIY